MAGASAMPSVHSGNLPADEVRRQLCARGRNDVAELLVNGLGEIAGKQQGEQSTSLLVWRARRVRQLRSDGG